MQLNELFDSEVDLQIMRKTDDYMEGEADIDGHTYKAFFDKEYTFDGSAQNVVWTLSFEDENGDLHLTGAGNEFKVFSFVKKFAEKAVKTYNPTIITVTAVKTETSRESLYRKLLTRYLKRYVDKGTVDNKNNDVSLVYVRKDIWKQQEKPKNQLRRPALRRPR